MDETNVKVIIDEDVKNYSSCARRPYYRMRGKPVTPEQAFDIIKRTDRFFDGMRWHTRKVLDLINCTHFSNWLVQRNHYPAGYGWIHVDGTVGCNAITSKYPDAEEFIDDCVGLAEAFPYLDLVIALTNWDEITPSERNYRYGPGDQSEDDLSGYYFESPEFDEDFLAAVTVGIWIHDGVVELMEPERTRKVYQEYASQYGDPDWKRYVSEYYEDRKISQVDKPYFRRLMESHGIDTPEVYKNIPRYELNPRINGLESLVVEGFDTVEESKAVSDGLGVIDCFSTTENFK